MAEDGLAAGSKKKLTDRDDIFIERFCWQKKWSKERKRELEKGVGGEKQQREWKKIMKIKKKDLIVNWNNGIIGRKKSSQKKVNNNYYKVCCMPTCNIFERCWH